jgi:hypothetical protein
MMAYLKRLFGYPKTGPVTMGSVETPPEPNPELVRENERATAQMVGSVMAVERKSYEVREELAHRTFELLHGRGR